jgi:nucleoside-diphosphate-sugar epimerase
MRLLVLGGTAFVGRAIAELAAARGHDVTVLNRGHHDTLHGVTTRTGDRTQPGGGLDALGDDTFDAVVDTWASEPQPIRDAVRVLTGRARHYTYISSISVYADPVTAPLTEDSPVTAPAEDVRDYAGIKRAGELATDAFDGQVLLARAGLILGPHENIGRLPWWLLRLHRGGPTLAPGPADLPVQLIDARDLAAFVLDAAADGRTGPYNLTSPTTHTTMRDLLETANRITGGHADLRWTDPDTILAAGIVPWTQLPIWLPPEYHGDTTDVTRALDAGLRLRPVADTIADTWTWLRALPGPPPQRPDRPAVGLAPETEAKVLGSEMR